MYSDIFRTIVHRQWRIYIFEARYRLSITFLRADSDTGSLLGGAFSGGVFSGGAYLGGVPFGGVKRERNSKVFPFRYLRLERISD